MLRETSLENQKVRPWQGAIEVQFEPLLVNVMVPPRSISLAGMKAWCMYGRGLIRLSIVSAYLYRST